MLDDNEKWTTTIEYKSKLFSLNIKEIWDYKDLIGLFIHRDFVTFYKQTILGPIWFIIQPLFTSGMFTIIFGKLAKVSTDEIPSLLFYMSGVINWSFFSDTISKTSDTFIANAGIFGKVYFPRLTVPIASAITGLIKYAIQYLIFIIILLYYIFNDSPIKPNNLIFLTPFLILQILLLSLGFGIWISAVTTKYRDLKFVLPFFIQLWMYATPVVYPLSLVPDKYKILISINPMVSIIELFKKGYLGTGTVNIQYNLMGICITFFILISGIIMFNRIEKTFMDTV